MLKALLSGLVIAVTSLRVRPVPRHAATPQRALLGYGSVGSMSLEDELAYWQGLSAPVWASDLERNGEPLPAWSAPEAKRNTAYGANSGDGPYVNEPPRPPLDLPPGWSQPQLPFPDPDSPDDPALDDTWARLVAAWAGDDVRGGADTRPAPRPAGSGHAGEGNGRTGIATRLVAGLRYWAHPGPWWAWFTGCAPVDTPPPGPGWEPSRLGTRFDAELAAGVARMIQEQNRDALEYLKRLWEDQ